MALHICFIQIYIKLNSKHI